MIISKNNHEVIILDAVDILIEEHKNIKKVLSVIKKDCEQLAHGKDVDTNFYRKVIDFVRNYADKYHHQKEEKKLFNIMSGIDENIKNGPIMGMLLEHDTGRAYISNLEKAVEEYSDGAKHMKAYIIANALSYAVMLEKHIEKEDTTIYMLARRRIDKSVQESLTEEFEDIEKDSLNTEIRTKYIEFAESV